MTERYDGMEFGLTHLGRAFHDGWRQYSGTEIEVLTGYVDQMPPYLVEAALIDALRLADPAVPTWVFETLWSVGTERRLDLRREGMDGRDWLRQIIQLCRNRLLKEGQSCPESAPPSPYGHLTGAVLDEIMLVSPGLLEMAQNSDWRSIPGVVPALSHAATHACPDLAFRFLLRALIYGPRITQAQYERYVALGAKFDYGELLVEGYDHLMA